MKCIKCEFQKLTIIQSNKINEQLVEANQALISDNIALRDALIKLRSAVDNKILDFTVNETLSTHH